MTREILVGLIYNMMLVQLGDERNVFFETMDLIEATLREESSLRSLYIEETVEVNIWSLVEKISPVKRGAFVSFVVWSLKNNFGLDCSGYYRETKPEDTRVFVSL